MLQVNSTCRQGDGITTIFDTGSPSVGRVNSILSLSARSVDMPASFFRVFAIASTSLWVKPWSNSSLDRVSPDATTTIDVHSLSDFVRPICDGMWRDTTKKIATSVNSIANEITIRVKLAVVIISFAFFMAQIIMFL